MRGPSRRITSLRGTNNGFKSSRKSWSIKLMRKIKRRSQFLLLCPRSLKTRNKYMKRNYEKLSKQDSVRLLKTNKKIKYSRCKVITICKGSERLWPLPSRDWVGAGVNLWDKRMIHQRGGRSMITPASTIISSRSRRIPSKWSLTYNKSTWYKQTPDIFRTRVVVW